MSSLQLLPVELITFNGRVMNNNIKLDWQTATELNNSHFDVEWSTDGISFEKIGQVHFEWKGDKSFLTENFEDLKRLHISPAESVDKAVLEFSKLLHN